MVSTQTVQHDYLTLNGKVARETITVDGTVTTVMDFIYDESGRPFALKYSDDGGKSFDTYYYVLNLQGDVVKLVWYIPGSEYEAVASYTYDAWGNITFLDGELAEINPLRYRGYYYDTETGFYYLQSRYYDPANRRFINADCYASTGQGFVGTNMFAYCLNNPVNCIDEYGEFPLTLAQLRIIHNMVATQVALKVGGVQEVTVTNQVNGKTVRGRLDVYVPETNVYYEIKPSHAQHRSRTRRQMEKYDGATAVMFDSPPISRGTTYVSGTLYFHGWRIEYKWLEDGLIGYSLKAPEVEPQVAGALAGVAGAVTLGLLFYAAGGGEKKSTAENLSDPAMQLA